MRFSTYGYAVAFTLATSACFAEEPSPPQGILAPTRTPNSLFAGEAMVRVEPPTVSAGETLRVICVVRCTGSTGELHNPFLSEDLKLPAQVVIISADGKTRREIMREAHVASERSTSWIRLFEGQSVGREFLITIAKNADAAAEPKPRTRAIELPPGEYYVQAIYTHWLLANRSSDQRGNAARLPRDEPLPLRSRSRAEMDAPQTVSEPVKLVVVANAGGPRAAVTRIACPLRADIRLLTPRATFGRPAKVEISMTNQSNAPLETYNPLLSPLLTQHACQLPVIPEDGKPIGDLLFRQTGSAMSASRNDFVTFPPGGTVSTQYSFTAGTTEAQQMPWLPPGTYALELRLFAPSIAGVPAFVTASKDGIAELNHPSYRDWLLSFPGPEICRSNRVELEILPRTGD